MCLALAAQPISGAVLGPALAMLEESKLLSTCSTTPGGAAWRDHTHCNDLLQHRLVLLPLPIPID